MAKKSSGMGFLKALFGLFGEPSKPKAEWGTVSETSLGDPPPWNKAFAKKVFRSYMEHCGFDKEEIREETESLIYDMSEEEDCLRGDIESHKEDLQDARERVNHLKDKMKNEGKTQELADDLECAKSDIEDLQDDIKKIQEELRDLKSNWKPYLIKYINERANSNG